MGSVFRRLYGVSNVKTNFMYVEIMKFSQRSRWKYYPVPAFLGSQRSRVAEFKQGNSSVLKNLLFASTELHAKRIIKRNYMIKKLLLYLNPIIFTIQQAKYLERKEVENDFFQNVNCKISLKKYTLINKIISFYTYYVLTTPKGEKTETNQKQHIKQKSFT